MATAILSSRNSLKPRFDHETCSRLRRNSNAAPRRLKHSSTASQSKTLVASPASNTNLVMGQVKILKRGETLSAFLNKENNSRPDEDVKKRHRLRMMSDADLIVTSNNRIGPEPETLQKQIGAFKGIDYAGACSSVSPPPDSLPIPCFLEKKN